MLKHWRSSLLRLLPLATLVSACSDIDPVGPAEVEQPEPPRIELPSFSVSAEDFFALAWVTTDKADYVPGEHVGVTGAGFAPGETVTLHFEESPPIHEPHTLTATADENGRIANAAYLIEEHDLGQAFTLTATGAESGFQATEFFTDHHSAGAVNPAITNAFVSTLLTVSGNFPPSRRCGVFFPTTFYTYRIELVRFGLPVVSVAVQNFGTSVRAAVPGRPPGIDQVFVRASASNGFCGQVVHVDHGGFLTWRQPNRAPVANAGFDPTVFRTSAAGAQVTLQGSGFDPDGDPIQATWHRPPGNPAVFAAGFRPSVLLPTLGPNALMLRVADNQGGVGSDVVVWTVLNNPPVANAGPDQTVECTGHDGASVTLDGSASSDIDGTVVEHVWTIDGNTVATGADPTLTLPLGTHDLTLRVRDNDGAIDTENVTVRVVDTTPPEITMSVSPTTLWPPNGGMVQVASGISASDLCDHAPSLTVSVTSDEPENGEGDGNTSPDWEVTQNADGTFDVWVRAERAGGGDGRTYTITATATDASGNSATQSATVDVPHDRGRGR